MSDEGISPYLAEIESEITTEAAGNPNNAVAFDMESEKNSVVETVEITDADYKKYLSDSQRSSLPKHLQEGIIRKKKISEAEEAAMPSFESLREETNASVPEAPQDPAEPEPDISHMGETPEPGMFEPDLGITEKGGPEEPPADPLPRPEPMEVSFVAERLNNQEQELQIASMTQKQFEDWLFPADREESDWASGQVALARIMANLKAAGYDSVSLSLDEELFPAYVQVASALWSRQNFTNPNREEVITQLENAPAAQLVSTLEATANAVPAELAAELFRAPEETTTNYLPYVGVGLASLFAFMGPYFWKR
tara:strand:+ start:2395 stop:3327 length:933 start_codon:yes stop_codon:yes gene_type:complete